MWMWHVQGHARLCIVRKWLRIICDTLYAATMTQITLPAPSHHDTLNQYPRPRTGTTTTPWTAGAMNITSLAPIIKTMRTTYIGGPDSGRTRNECWEARSTDGTWGFERIEDVGTSWRVTHLPSGYTCDTPYHSLTSARRAVQRGLTLRSMVKDCQETIRDSRLPEDMRQSAEAQLSVLLACFSL